MANIYVRSTDGSDADDGSTWALAEASLTGAAAADAAGDTIYVSDNHAESTAGAVTIALAGTLASPTRVLCVDDSAEPPTALATTGTVTVSTNAALTISGSAYVYGLTFTSGGTIIMNGGAANAATEFDTCKFATANAGSAGHIDTAGAWNVTNKIKLKNCTFNFSGSANYFLLNGAVSIRGGSFAGTSATPTYVFRFAADRTAGSVEIDGLDFSALASTVNIFAGSTTSVPALRAVMRNCKLPASWSGGLLSAAPGGYGQRYEMWNCDSTDTNYRIWIEDYSGSIKQSTTVYKDAFSGGTKHSYVFASTANAEYPLIRLVGPDFFADNATTGSSVTATVEIVTDNVTLTDEECWLELMYMGTSGVPLGTWVTDCKADVLATAANQATSTETWTTTGLTTPVKQKLTVSFTPQEAGYVIGRVVLAKASTTVYVDPALTLS